MDFAAPSSRFDCLSPIDYRYYDPDVAEILSEAGYIAYACRVETALARVLARANLCSPSVAEDIAQGCAHVTAAEVYAEELRTKHDVRALVNVIGRHTNAEARPFIHLTATSFDIRDTANILRVRDVTRMVLNPAYGEWMLTAIALTHREAATKQIGRTHGQHAVPITFGFALAWFVDRMGNCFEHLQDSLRQLRGKFSGAVGSLNAAALFFDDPTSFEHHVLRELGLEPGHISTQIVQPEPLQWYYIALVSMAGVLANMANDFRNLQRTEIDEVREGVAGDQVGSSTMSHKQNPISSEQVVSFWKVLLGHQLTVMLDQQSDHQRDLTNSASSRFTLGEMIAVFIRMLRTSTNVLKGLIVNSARMAANLGLTRGLIASEPLQLLLAFHGCPDAHEQVRVHSRTARILGQPLVDVARTDTALAPYFARMTTRQEAILRDPTTYVGIAEQRAHEIAKYWTTRLG